MWLLVAPRAAKVLMVMRASVSSRLILASAPQNGAVRGSQPEAAARKSGCRLTRNLNCPPSPVSQRVSGPTKRAVETALRRICDTDHAQSAKDNADPARWF